RASECRRGRLRGLSARAARRGRAGVRRAARGCGGARPGRTQTVPRRAAGGGDPEGAGAHHGPRRADDDADRQGPQIRAARPGPALGMSAEPVVYTVADAIATLTLNRPQSRNALSDDLLDALLLTLERARGDEAVRVIVLASSHDKVF